MPKDEHRKFKHCIFCGVSLTKADGPHQRTREHLFGDTIAEILPDLGHWKASTRLFDNNPNKGSSPARYVTSYSVCKGCNTGWMSDDMKRAIPLMTNLYNGIKSNFSQEEIVALKRYFWRMAALVDVESSSLELAESKKIGNTY